MKVRLKKGDARYSEKDHCTTSRDGVLCGMQITSGRWVEPVKKPRRPVKGHNLWANLFYPCRTLAMVALVHNHNTDHLTPMLMSIESFGQTIVNHEHLSLSLYAVDGFQAKFWCFRPYMRVICKWILVLIFVQRFLRKTYRLSLIRWWDWRYLVRW